MHTPSLGGLRKLRVCFRRWWLLDLGDRFFPHALYQNFKLTIVGVIRNLGVHLYSPCKQHQHVSLEVLHVDLTHRPTRMTYNTLLDAYAKAKEVQGAETVLKKMTKDR